jgi:8-hydroxy-5-deazaflavin:NADPH oxidoreductase
VTTIGLIGAGNIGGTVARLAVAAGYDAVVSNSRGPETLTDLVGELGPNARAATPAEAARAADLVVVTIPLKAYRSVPVEPLVGKVVIDTNNYYPGRDGRIAALDDRSTTSSELLQHHLPEAKVVKCFNCIFFRHLQALARPSGSPERSALPIAGDDPQAKVTVAAFLDAIGYDTVDVGSLAEGWRFQPGAPVYGLVYAGGSADLAASPGVPAGLDMIRQSLAAASR